MYWCLPDGSKCEWRNLRGFVEQYNKEFGLQYELSECLDITADEKPQPEIRLKSKKDKDMVIEHKVIVWPPDYLQSHRVQHHFMEAFFKSIGEEFQDDQYVLELSTEHMKPKTRTVVNWAKNIATTIINKKEKIRKVSTLKSVKPIPWTFRKLSSLERDDDGPDRGVRVHFWSAPDEFENYDSEYKKIFEEVKTELSRHLAGTSKKFMDYEDCVRIFITELYGEHLLLGSEMLEDIIKDTLIPTNIDQIWMGSPEWVDNNTFETEYNKLFVRDDK